MSKQKGFTLVELVIVLVLVGILSVFVASLFADRNVYDQRITSDFLTSNIRQAQQTAIARANDGFVQLQLAVSGQQWLATISASNGASSQQNVDRQGRVLYGGTDTSASCSALSALPLQLAFDGDGSLSSGQNFRFCVPDELEMCVSASGYAYVGACL